MSDPVTPPNQPHGAPPPPGGYQQQPGDQQQPGGFPQGGSQQQPPAGGYQQPPAEGYQQQPPAGGYQQQSGGYQQGPQGGYPPAGAYGGVASGVGQPGNLTDRFLAKLIDFVILVVVNMILVSFLIVGVLMNSSGGMYGLDGGSFLVGVVSSVLIAAIYLGYFAFMESSRGQTIGKMAMKLQTRGQGGGNPTMEEALKRNAWVGLSVLGIIPLVGGIVAGLAQLAAMILIAVGINGDAVGRRGWHDQFAGTQVIKIG